MTLCSDALAEAEIAGHGGADFHDLAGKFMADNHGYGNDAGSPFIPVVDVNIGPADGCRPDLYQHVIRARSGDRSIDLPDAFACFGLGQGFHGARAG